MAHEPTHHRDLDLAASTHVPSAGRSGPNTRMIAWAGWLMLAYGTVHTLAALTVEGAAGHAGAWFGGELWSQDLSEMGPAASAYWLSLASFGPPLIVIGLTVLWLHRRGITPPQLIGWALGGLALVDAVVSPFTPWPILLIASVALVLGVRRAERHSP